MMMLFMSHATVGADELDAIVLNPVDSPEMNAVRTDHFHMFANIFEAAHGFASYCLPPTLRSRHSMRTVGRHYARLQHVSPVRVVRPRIPA
jgi:hypothetical protein